MSGAVSQYAFAQSASPVEPGCYVNTQQGFRPVEITDCATEGAARAVSEFGACFVGAEERDCNDLSQPGGSVPESATPGAGTGGPRSGTTGLDVQRSEFESQDCNDTELDTGNCRIIEYLVAGINTLSALAGMAIIFSIMFAGYQYMTARDNAGQIQQARTRIIWAIVAMLVFIFMYGALNFLIPGGVI